MSLKLYHNPRCSKSRLALQLLEESGKKFQVIEYLNADLKSQDYEKLIEELDLPSKEIIRLKEKVLQELELDLDNLSRPQLAKLLSTNPILLERPILSNGRKAIQGRPPENILELLK